MDSLVNDLLFEWDENKRKSTLKKHVVDFQDAIRMFKDEVLTLPSHRLGETRWMAGGRASGVELTVIYAIRGDRRPTIAARRAHKNERRKYFAHVAGAGDPP